METNYTGCLIGILIIFYLSTIKSLEDPDITIITSINWIIYILFSKVGIKWHLLQ